MGKRKLRRAMVNKGVPGGLAAVQVPKKLRNLLIKEAEKLGIHLNDLATQVLGGWYQAYKKDQEEKLYDEALTAVKKEKEGRLVQPVGQGMLRKLEKEYGEPERAVKDIRLGR